MSLNNGQSVVVRFKNESDVTLEVINAQSRFAKFLADNGIKTPALFMASHEYARWYTINRYDVIVTVEEFVTEEIHVVSEEIAEKPVDYWHRCTTLQKPVSFMFKMASYLIL